MTNGRWQARSILIAGVLLLFRTNVSEAPDAGILLARVETSEGTPLQGVASIPRSLAPASPASSGGVTDRAGEYRISLPPGRYSVILSLLGWEAVADTVDVLLGAETTLNRQMRPAAIDLEEVGQPGRIFHFIREGRRTDPSSGPDYPPGQRAFGSAPKASRTTDPPTKRRAAITPGDCGSFTYREGDSNPHALRRSILSRVRLPFRHPGEQPTTRVYSSSYRPHSISSRSVRRGQLARRSPTT